ncbi:Glycoside hydrolase [Coniochaeta hoffmannii]|uniref:Glycoside hydrolase n=1 Tax=Coniochaeta hoffmannii TaxID=91930 RepID=A0AA38VRA6_9PEZI|nr:Glycoside hydrolase [Coniochaeta hoffmannii]
MFFAKTYAAVCGLATLSSAHMIMSSPKPFGGVGQAPLLEDGSNFPCQMTAGGSYQSQGSTTMAKGSPQELAFIGQAVHGGGSCQVSITYDTAPTKNSVWKVIHSIQGGCPAKNQQGNMGNSASAADPFTYQFQIPDDVPTGNATIAWTWLNRIGNREYYMNCAPISITGSSGDKANFDALPDMLVANIPAITSCTTKDLEGKDYKYPNPGNSVDNFNMTDLVSLNGDCGKVATGGSGSGSGSGSQPSSSAAPVQAPTTSAVKGSATLPGGVFITVPAGNGGASSPAAQPTQAQGSSQAVQPTQAAPTTQVVPTTFASVAKTSTAAASATTTASPAGSTGSSGSGSTSGSASGAQTAGSACSPEGLWNCVGGTSFQQCGSGLWSPVMALAAGMKCTPGQSTVLEMQAINGKLRRRLTRFSS